MNVDHDKHTPVPANNNEDQTFSDYDEVFTHLLIKYVTRTAPHLFALCRESCEDAEDWVFAWGAAFDDTAVLFNPNDKFTGRFTSADTALNLFSKTEDLRLIWLNPTPYNQPDAIAA